VALFAQGRSSLGGQAGLEQHRTFEDRIKGPSRCRVSGSHSTGRLPADALLTMPQPAGLAKKRAMVSQALSLDMDGIFYSAFASQNGMPLSSRQNGAWCNTCSKLIRLTVFLSN